VGGAVAAGAAALGLSALAVSEALVANSPSSTGDDKERARVVGPIATAAAGLAVAAAGACLVVVVLGGD
jgi:hypothetical protein